MLHIEHKAPHLYREDAYREYSWSVDAYGAYQPASFIYLCFESFHNLCSHYGLKLIYSSQSQSESGFPWRFEQAQLITTYPKDGLIIIRIEDFQSVSEIKTALTQGKNVIALLPNEMLALWYGSYDEKHPRTEKAIQAARELGITQAEQKISPTATNRDAVWWEEVPTNNDGRLFITRDAFLSDGYFMDKYGKTEENSAMIDALAREFSIFKHPVLRMEVRNIVNIWPCHEPISLVVEMINHGPTLDDVEVNLDVGDEFEPISPMERVISNIRSLGKTSFPFQVVPRLDGKFDKPFELTAIVMDSQKTVIPLRGFIPKIEIIPGYGNTLRSHTKRDDATLSKLFAIFKDTKLFEEIKIVSELASIDVKASLNRMRSVTEKLTYTALAKKNIRQGHSNFASAIQLVKSNHILSTRSVGYLHTIRVIGNLASHPNDENLTDTDVRIVSFALACVTEELLDKNLV